MLALVATLLAQTCSYDGQVCAQVVGADYVQAYVFQPVGAYSGLAMRSRRTKDDQSPDLTLLPRDGVDRDLDTPYIELRRSSGSQVIFRVLNSGEVQGGGQQDSTAAFTDISGADGHPTLACAGGTGGCYLILRANMLPSNNGAFHGLLTVGNASGARDGGLGLQLQGTGRTSAQGAVFHGTTTAVDDFGNLVLRDGWVFQQLHTADRGVCYASAVWDGEWHQPGGYGYDVDEDALVFRSASACAADGGVEHVVTDRSLTAALALINARLSALEAR